MIRPRSVRAASNHALVAALVGTLTLSLMAAGCAGDGADRGTSSKPSDWRVDESADDRGAGRQARGQPAEANITWVSLPSETTREIDAFLGEPRTILADHIVVELSRAPFLGWSSFNGAEDTHVEETAVEGHVVLPDLAVRRTEYDNNAAGYLRVTLENMTGVRTSYPALPRAKIGPGLTLIGIEKIELRYVKTHDPARPLYIKIQASGEARLLQPNATEPRRKGRRIEVSAHVLQAQDGYVFGDRVHIDP